MKVVYRGPSPEVVVIIDGGGIHALRDEPVEVPAELGRSLCEQDTFEEVKHKPVKDKPAGPAAPTKDEG